MFVHVFTTVHMLQIAAQKLITTLITGPQLKFSIHYSVLHKTELN